MRSIILFLFAVGVLLLAHWAMPRIVGGLRRMSRLPENRLTEDEAVPVWFMGNFERAMAVVLVLANVRGAYALLAAWLGAKLATSWQRLPIDNTDLETSRQSQGRNAGRAHGGDNLRYIRDRRRPTFPRVCVSRRLDAPHHLTERIRAYQPLAIVTLLLSIKEIMDAAAIAAGSSAARYAVPFPGMGQQARFLDAMARIVPALPQAK